MFPIQLFKMIVFIQPERNMNVTVNSNSFYEMLRGLFLNASESISSFPLPCRLCP